MQKTADAGGLASDRRPRARSPLARLRHINVRQVRLTCGVILYAYLVTHFVNHALGNISLDAMEDGLRYHLWLWHSLPGTVALYAALIVHGCLGLWALYERRHFRRKLSEGTQLVLGLTIPLVLAGHVIAQRVAYELYGIENGYAQSLYGLWVKSSTTTVLQTVALIIAWAHGSIGIYFWLRLKRYFRRIAPLLLAIAVLLPTLALLGFYQGGRAVAERSTSAAWRDDNLNHGATDEREAHLREIHDGFLYAWAGAIALVLLARGLRTMRERRRGTLRLTYPDGRTIRVPRGLSVLESSQRFNIPHASVCGGRGRCSTCRIRVLGDRSALPPPSPNEAAVLERVGVAGDKAVRLACQLRPEGDIVLVPLLPPHADISHVHEHRRVRAGEERYVVCMFVDMRGSTRLAEKRLPFDTVFIINRFLAAVSQGIIDAGGEPNQFLGDGLLALFGLASEPTAACRQALHAAAMIAANVDRLNQLFANDLIEPIRFGMGIHGGEVIIGDIGYRDRTVFTALGDAVNVTSRLQDMTKSLGCEVVLSDEVRELAGIDPSALPAADVEIRGRVEPMHVRTAVHASLIGRLPEIRSQPQASTASA